MRRRRNGEAPPGNAGREKTNSERKKRKLMTMGVEEVKAEEKEADIDNDK